MPGNDRKILNFREKRLFKGPTNSNPGQKCTSREGKLEGQCYEAIRLPPTMPAPVVPAPGAAAPWSAPVVPAPWTAPIVPPHNNTSVKDGLFYYMELRTKGDKVLGRS